VQTDPNDPNGAFAGRKLLFGAITLLDDTSNVIVVSQPCAVAMHPNGLTSFALACASDDILTFDMTLGVAVGILRNLPGSHPVGLALDATGDRAFILSDQSKTLLTVDLAGGSLLGDVSIVDGPLSLVASDPVDPDLRAGLTAFFSADSSVGTLTTTGNNWISCGGCHLDGFGSPTLRLFESASIVDPTVNAHGPLLHRPHPDLERLQPARRTGGSGRAGGARARSYRRQPYGGHRPVRTDRGGIDARESDRARHRERPPDRA
jgi:hypothetical protein